MQRVKNLIHRYNAAQQASAELTAIKKELVPLLKQQGLTATKFQFDNGRRYVEFHSYSKPEEITQTMIKSYVRRNYPNINADAFMTGLRQSRKKRVCETVRAVNAKSKK